MCFVYIQPMSPFLRWVLISISIFGCGSDDVQSALPTHEEPGSRAPYRSKQIPPPIDLAVPADAIKTSSGLTFKRLIAKSGVTLQPGQRAQVRYTGWRQRTGETFFTTSRPIEIDPSAAASVFREVLPLLRKGEKVVLWAPAGDGVSEPIVYEIELVDVVAPGPVVARPASQ